MQCGTGSSRRTDLKVTAAGNSANATAAVSTRVSSLFHNYLGGMEYVKTATRRIKLSKEAKLPADRLEAVSNAGLTKT